MQSINNLLNDDEDENVIGNRKEAPAIISTHANPFIKKLPAVVDKHESQAQVQTQGQIRTEKTTETPTESPRNSPSVRVNPTNDDIGILQIKSPLLHDLLQKYQLQMIKDPNNNAIDYVVLGNLDSKLKGSIVIELRQVIQNYGFKSFSFPNGTSDFPGKS